MLLALALCSFLAVGLSAGAGTAHALLPPVVEQNFDAITEQLQRGGSAPHTLRDIPTATELHLAEHRPMPGQPSSHSLWQDLNRVRKKAKVVKLVRAGTVVGIATIAGEFAIQEGAKIFFGDSGGQPDETATRIVFWTVPAGDTIRTPFSCCLFVTHPEDVWYVRTEGGNTPGRGDYSGCFPTAYTPNAATWSNAALNATPTYIGSGGGTSQGCTYTYDGNIALDPVREILSARPSIDATAYSGPIAATLPAPAAPTQPEVDTDVRTFLESPEGEDLRQWYRWALDEPGIKNPYTGEVNVPDIEGEPGQSYESYAQTLTDLGLTPVPVEAPEYDYDYDDDSVLGVTPAPGTNLDAGSEVEVERNPRRTQPTTRDCELVDGPAQGDPDPDRGSEFVPRYDVVRHLLGDELFQRNTGSGLVVTRLRYGWTFLGRDGRWKGWGWRHIAANHSWTEADREATRLALLNPPVSQHGGSYDYDGAETYPGRNGATCRRRVVVQTRLDDNEVQYSVGPKDIVNSYGRLVAGSG